MDLLIIGKNGFVGKNLYEFFSRLDKYNVKIIGSAELNLLDERCTNTFFENNHFDIVFDTAIYNPRIGIGKDSAKELEYDLLMFHNLAKNHDKYGKMIYFGSGAEYDKRFPICSVSEEDLSGRAETLDTNKKCSGFIPTTQYGLAKYIIGQEIEAGIYSADNIYNLRIFGLFGKYENWKTTFISGACCKALKNLPITIRQDVYFDYLYIDDFCRMIKLFIDLDRPKYHSFNITSGRRITLTEIADVVKKVSGKNVPVYVCTEGLANEYTASNQRLVNEIGGYECEAMTNSVKELYLWYKSISGEIDLASLLYQ